MGLFRPDIDKGSNRLRLALRRPAEQVVCRQALQAHVVDAPHASLAHRHALVHHRNLG